MERTFDINVAREQSEEFVLHFNALLSQYQRRGEGSGQFDADFSKQVLDPFEKKA